MASAKGARNAAIWGAGLLQGNEGKLLSELDTGYKAATDLYGQAKDVYQPYADRYGAASTMYGNALGLNGADGTAAAQSAFQAGPGYQWQMDQGLDAVNRSANARGMLGSGNTSVDLLKYGQGLANQEYGNWLGNLSGLDARGLTTAGAQAGTLTGLGNLATDYYGSRASVMDDTTKNIVGLGTAAFKAGDQAKAANQQMLMGGIQMGANLLGSLMGGGGLGGGAGGLGGLSKLFGG